jgi:hypothetical protein
MIRTAQSVIAGYAVIALLVIATDAVVGAAFHGTRKTFTIVNLAAALPWAAAGGYTAACIAKGKEMGAAIGLSLFAAIMSIVTLAIDRGRQPLWYWGALLILLAAGALCGGYLRSRQTNKLVA